MLILCACFMCVASLLLGTAVLLMLLRTAVLLMLLLLRAGNLISNKCSIGTACSLA